MQAKTTRLNLPLILSLALGLGLRVYRFDSIAPSNSDEASYLRHARFMVTLAKTACRMDVPVIDDSATGLWRHVRKADWSEKPCWLHSALIAGSMAVFGVNDAAGAAVSIAFSLGAVALCFFIGLRIAGEGVGWSAAAFLAVSFYWMLYSRGMWAEADAVFFVLLALHLLFVARPRSRSGLDGHSFVLPASAGILPPEGGAPSVFPPYAPYLLSGVSAAAAVLCHYRFLYAIAPLGVALLLLTKPRTWLWRSALFAAGFAGVLLGAALALRLAAAAAGPGVPFTGLIGALLERYLPGRTGVEQKGIQFTNATAVAYYFLRNHGWAMTGLTLLGIVVSLFNATYDRRHAALLCMGLLPLGILCFQVWVVARAASAMIPFACILAGVGLVTVWRVGDAVTPRWRRLPRAAAIVLTFGVLVENGAGDLRLALNRMGHEDAAAVLAGRARDAVFVDPESAILYGWYAPDVPYESIRRLDGAESMNGLTHAAVVFDGQKYHMYPESVARVDELERRVARRGRRIARIPNMTTIWREFLLDGTQAHTLGDMLQSIRAADQEDVTSIRVYEAQE